MQLNPDLIRDILLKAELGSFKILKNNDELTLAKISFRVEIK